MVYDTQMNAIGDNPKLRAISLAAMPPLHALDPMQRAQLHVIAQQPYGEERSVEQLVYQGAEHAPFELSIVSVHGDEGPAFDAWLNEGDEGMIFRSSTTEVVGSVEQGGVECVDRALLAALRQALAWSRLSELRAARGGNLGGPWAAYRAARAHWADDAEDGAGIVTEVSGDGTLPSWRDPPDDDDVPF